jgi:hypothetical protein
MYKIGCSALLTFLKYDYFQQVLSPLLPSLPSISSYYTHKTKINKTTQLKKICKYLELDLYYMLVL